MFRLLFALFPLVVCRVHAFPLSRSSTAKTYYIPLVVLSVFLFLLLVVIKLVYMKQRRIGTIHAPPVPSSREKEHRGLMVGCLGSPEWETNLTARLNGTSSSFGRDTMRSTRSTCAHTKSTSFSSRRWSGEPRGLGFPGNSVVSIQLVDGPSYSGQVEYAFLSGLPPTAILVSPLTSTRDSFQLSRCSLKCKPVPLPPLPEL